jgi:hypothetical protein
VRTFLLGVKHHFTRRNAGRVVGASTSALYIR